MADTDADGKMDINEFSIACKLINLKLRGYDIPKGLPPSLLASLKSTPPAIPPLPNTSLVNAPPRPEPPKVAPIVTAQPLVQTQPMLSNQSLLSQVPPTSQPLLPGLSGGTLPKMGPSGTPLSGTLTGVIAPVSNISTMGMNAQSNSGIPTGNW